MKKTNSAFHMVVAVLAALILGYVLHSFRHSGAGDSLVTDGTLFLDIGWLADLGKVIVHWIKLLAGPFLFLTVLISVLQVHIPAALGLRLVIIALGNTCVALSIGMILVKAFLQSPQPDLVAAIGSVTNPTAVATPGFWKGFLDTLMPKSLFAPFFDNNILWLALTGLALGLAGRRVLANKLEQWQKLVQGLSLTKDLNLHLLSWLLALAPIAVFSILTSVVAEHGFSLFGSLWLFVGVVLGAFLIQIVVVYGFWLFIVARLPWRSTLDLIRIPCVYALGVNSSLATLPLTLSTLKELGVSDRAGSLGAGVATNLNNDGIVLYEAIAVYFIAAALGHPMDWWQMISAAGICIVASMGITGVPEAGFISLTMVVGVLNLPAEVLPVLLSVDWLLARFRSGVNVLSDITLSVAIDKIGAKL